MQPETYPFKGYSNRPRAEHLSCCVQVVLQCNAEACAQLVFEGKIPFTTPCHHFETTLSSGAKYGRSSPVTKRSAYSGVQKSLVSWYVLGGNV